MINNLKRLRNLFPLALACLILVGFCMFGSAGADGPDWLDTSESPTVTQEWTNNTAFVPNITDNLGCSNVTFKESNGTSKTECLLQTQAGQMGSGWFIPNNATLGGSLSDNLLNPIPNTNSGYILTTDDRIIFYPNLYTSLTPTIVSGNTQYTVASSSGDPVLEDGAGNVAYVNANDIAFSDDGQYMVTYDSTAHSFVEVNTTTHSMIPFAGPTNYLNSTAIGVSPDGRYVAIHDEDSGVSPTFTIYDLSTCGTVPDDITEPVSCSSRNIQSYISSAISGYQNVETIRFQTDNLITIEGFGSSGSGSFSAQYDIEAPGLATGNTSYLGLGDSYSSGEGAAGTPNSSSENTGPGGYIVGTDDSPDNRCHSSPESYPSLIAQDLSYSSSQFETIACSGAKTVNVVSPNKGAQYPTAPADNDLGDWLPGLEPQYEHVGDTLPSVMTMTMGGNDIGFNSIVIHCIEAGDCYTSYQDRLNLVNKIDNEYKTWQKMYTKLLREDPGSRLYVIGYPQVADTGDCADNVRLSSDDITFSRQLVAYLDYVIQQAADSAGAIYVDTQSALDGHELCQTTSDDAAVNGLTFDRNGQIISAGSYHPNVLGQQLLAESIESTTDDFSSPSTIPSPDPSVSQPSSSDTDSQVEAMLDVSGSPTTNVNLVPLLGPSGNSGSYVDNIYNKSGNITYNIDGIDYGLIPNTSYTLTFHSDPVTVGTYTTDSDGNLDISTPVPGGVEPGLHAVDITGPDMSGENLDLFGSAYVNEVPTDLTATSPTNESPALTWTAAADADSYNVYRDGVQIDNTTDTSYTDTGATSGTHSYYVTAVFADDTESGNSNTVNVAYDSALPLITNFTSNDGTTITRQNVPFTSGVSTQTVNSDGSISLNVNDAPGAAESGFYLYDGPLSGLPDFTVDSSSGDFGLDLWFDNAGLGDFFQWNSSGVETGSGGDTYGASAGSTDGSLAVSGDTTFTMNDDGENYTLSQLIAGDDSTSGIDGDTPVAVWIGVGTDSGGGSAAATISSISGL